MGAFEALLIADLYGSLHSSSEMHVAVIMEHFCSFLLISCWQELGSYLHAFL